MACSDRKRESKACSLNECFFPFVLWIDFSLALDIKNALQSRSSRYSKRHEKNILKEGIGVYRIFSCLPLPVKYVEGARTCVH